MQVMWKGGAHIKQQIDDHLSNKSWYLYFLKRTE